jgi:hypothetical protein
MIDNWIDVQLRKALTKRSLCTKIIFLWLDGNPNRKKI